MAEKRDPVTEYLKKIGSQGGKARVPKGTAVLSEADRKKQASAAARARWGTKKAAATKKAKKK